MVDVVLVDERDNKVGLMEKMEAHQKALLHRAFSVFIMNSQGEIMLQQRALSKYHCGGMWTNTCCSHPFDNEKVIDAAHRRLKEEMGFDTGLREVFSFIYTAPFSNGLTEHELDHVFIGVYEGEPDLDEEEAASWKWISPEDLVEDISLNPDEYTPWFRIIMQKFSEEKPWLN